MAKYGANSIVIEYDNSAGTTTDITQYVQECNGFDIEAVLEESHTFGDAWVEQQFVSLRKVGDITLKGMFDDAAAANTVFNDPGNTLTANSTTRTLRITWGGTKTSAVETWVKNYRRMPARGTITKFELVLAPSGAVTEA